MVRRETRSLGQFGRTLFPILALCFFWVGAALAADNAECFKCHQNPRLSKGKKDGSLLSLHVDEKAFKASVHGAAGMGCTDCHQEAKPNVHPAEGFPEVGCANCHQDSAEAYKKTSPRDDAGKRHGTGAQMPGLPYFPLHPQDRRPSIAGKGFPALPEACAKCHEEAKPPRGFFTALATYRIMGHPKTDLEYRYDTQGCANCHPENTGHPQKRGPGSLLRQMPRPLRFQTPPPGADPSQSVLPGSAGSFHPAYPLRGSAWSWWSWACIVFFGYRTYKRRRRPKKRRGKTRRGRRQEQSFLRSASLEDGVDALRLPLRIEARRKGKDLFLLASFFAGFLSRQVQSDIRISPYIP